MKHNVKSVSFRDCMARETYAGAEKFPNGDDPVIRVVAGMDVIADRGGVEVYDWSKEDDLGNCLFWQLLVNFPNATSAMAFLDGLKDDFDPISCGFEEGV